MPDPTDTAATVTVHIVHPGYVRSRHDGDRHYVGFLRLASLCGLDPSDRRVFNADSSVMTAALRGWENDPDIDVQHHYPSEVGDYA